MKDDSFIEGVVPLCQLEDEILNTLDEENFECVICGDAFLGVLGKIKRRGFYCKICKVILCLSCALGHKKHHKTNKKQHYSYFKFLLKKIHARISNLF